MLSKAPPVPEILKQAPDEQSAEREAEAEGSENAGRSATAVESSNAEGEIINEEPQAAVANANRVDHREANPGLVRAGILNQQLEHRPAPRIQRSNDDRLLTWAAVGLTVAIVFLLLKKLVKSGGYGAIFLSES